MRSYAIDSNIREKVHHYIFLISLVLASIITVAFNVLVKDIVATNIWMLYLNILILPSMGGIDAVLNWLFNKRLWKLKLINKILNIPNLNGVWIIQGENTAGYTYSGKLNVYQTFTKISIKGSFYNSKSENHETFISCNSDEIRLSYNYINEPKKKEGTMGIHHGFAVITFENCLNKATAKYFNDVFRETFGTWEINREN